MLAFHMILAQHSRRSTSLAHTLAPLLHFPGRDENLVTETPFSRPLFSSTSALFHFPYPVTPLFATLTKTAGVYTNNSHSGTSSSRAKSKGRSPQCSSSFFSYSCALFCTYQNLNPFVFKYFHTLFRNGRPATLLESVPSAL